MDTNLHTIFELERKLLYLNKMDFEQILAHHFIEIDENGLTVTKEKRLAQLAQMPSYSTIPFIISNFKSKDVAQTVLHTMYQTTCIETGEQLIHSSIWQLYQNNWQQIFHQKTKLK